MSLPPSARLIIGFGASILFLKFEFVMTTQSRSAGVEIQMQCAPSYAHTQLTLYLVLELFFIYKIALTIVVGCSVRTVIYI